MNSTIRSITRSLLIFTVVFSFSLTTGAGESETSPSIGWRIKERLLPPPAAASKETREALAAASAPDIAASQMERQSIEKMDSAAMIKMIEAAQLQGGPPTLQFAKTLGVTVERDVIDGVKVHYVTPKEVDPKFKNSVFLHVHGGAYVFGGGDGSVGEGVIIANASKVPVLSIDYRMPPKSPFPAAVDDVVTVYKHLLKTMPGKSIAIGGTSAGGGLALAAVHQFKALDLDTPAAIYAGTPWADLTKTGDTLYTNEGIDRVLITYDGALSLAAQMYANGHDMKDPLISPVYGSFEAFPPTYLVTGTRDMFLSDTARVHRKMRAASVVAELNVYESLSHGEYTKLELPESRQVYSEMREFLLTHLH